MKISKTKDDSAAAVAPAATTTKNNENKEPADVGKVQKKKGRRKKIKDASAPKHPLTGYIRFMNVRREELRKSHPNTSAVDMTKMIGEDWNSLKEDDRKPYMEAAKMDKERYNQECLEYNAKFGNPPADDDQQQPMPPKKPLSKPLKSQQQKTSDESSSENTDNNTFAGAAAGKTNGFSTPIVAQISALVEDHVKETTPKLQRTGDYDIPIFTEEFLEHNKCVDAELRSLRKSNTDYEQQNSILEKHVDNMQNGIEKLVNESNELKANNDALNRYLTKLKSKLATALAGLSIPGEPNGANNDNIDKYMADLLQMASSNSHGPASLNKAKDIIRKLDLQLTN